MLVPSLLPGLANAHQDRGKPLVVKTAEGVLRGSGTSTLNIFKGIRYGEDTSGQRRFRPPVPVRSWIGVRDATKLGPPSPQDINGDTKAWLDPSPPSEDCLFLNVWSPKKAHRAPVMVWLHGGGYWVGSGGVPGYDGSGLAERGNVVVVTINHRLNAFGYLYLGGLSDEFADSANLGRLDLVAALRWVQRNIAAFGGDPSNVTIFGESGGGMKVSVLAGMPMARGLFQKAIVQSGSAVQVQTAAEATDMARAFVTELGLTSATVGDIRSVPMQQLVNAYLRLQAKSQAKGDTFFWLQPLQHAETVPYQLGDIRSRQLWRDVPLLVGVNDAESASRTATWAEARDDAELYGQLARFSRSIDSAKAQALVAAYRKRMPTASRKDLLVVITSGSTWIRALRQAELKVDTGGAPVYMYQYGWKDPIPGGNWAIHGVELPFLFDKLDLPWLWDNSDTPNARAKLDPGGRRFILRDATIAAWSGFARGGTPANTLMPPWPPFTIGNRAVMHINANSELQTDPFGPEVRQLASSFLLGR